MAAKSSWLTRCSAITTKGLSLLNGLEYRMEWWNKIKWSGTVIDCTQLQLTGAAQLD